MSPNEIAEKIVAGFFARGSVTKDEMEDAIAKAIEEERAKPSVDDGPCYCDSIQRVGGRGAICGPCRRREAARMDKKSVDWKNLVQPGTGVGTCSTTRGGRRAGKGGVRPDPHKP